MNREDVLRLLDEMVEYQRGRVLSIARELVPGLTLEDIRNPQDYQELENSSRFQFEDGILSGYISMRTAVAAEFNQQEESPKSPS